MAIDLNTNWTLIHEQSLYRTNTKLRVYAKVKSQDIANNSSVVATWMGIYISDNYTYTTSSCIGHVSGASDFSYSNKTFPGNTETYLSGGEFTAGHNNDGTGRTYCTWWLSQTFGGSVSYTESTWLNLPTIPRTSYVSVSDSNMTAGSTYTVNTNRKSTSFTHTITYSIGSASGTIGTNVSDGISWTPSTSLCAQFPNANSKSGTITCVTYNGSTQIGTSTCSFLLSIPSASNPNISINSITENNSNVSSKSSTITVQILSNKTVKVTCTPKYSSSISKVYCDGVALQSSGNNVYTGVLSNRQSGTYSFFVTDSRGLSSSTSFTQTFYNYSYPTINGTVTRNSSTDSNGKLTVNGTYSNILNNTVTMTIQRNSESAATVSPTVSSGTISLTKTYSDLNYTSVFEFIIKVTDSFKQTASITVNLGLGEFALWLGKNGAILGKESKIATSSSSYKSLLDFCHPVGSIYMSTNSTSPATLFGGTWEQLPKNRFLVGAGDLYGVGSTGGGTKHCHTTGGATISIAQMPSHDHAAGMDWAYAGWSGTSPLAFATFDNNSRAGSGWGGTWSNRWTTDSGIDIIVNRGSTQSHNHGNTGYSEPIPYYYAVYMWRRTA